LENCGRIVVVSDDSELGTLIALNLRRRGHTVAHVVLTQEALPTRPPPPERPALIVLDLEAPEGLHPARLRSLLDEPWASGVPVLVAVEDSRRLIEEIGPSVTMIPRADDIGAIVAEARAFFASADSDRPMV